MDSSNLAICFGPTILTPACDQSLPLEVHKGLTDKVGSVLLLAALTAVAQRKAGHFYNTAVNDTLTYLFSNWLAVVSC